MTAGFDHRALKQRRADTGLSQDEVALTLGVTRQAVSNWERGIDTPGVTYLPNLAHLFDCRIDDLFVLVTTGGQA